MMRKYVVLACTLVAAAIALAATTSQAADNNRAPVAFDRNVPVTREAAPSLPDYTIYRPTDLRRSEALPVILWENGGCADTNGPEAPLLTRIAASGFFVLARGPVSSLPPTLPAHSPLLNPNPPLEPPVAAGKFTTVLPDFEQTLASTSAAMESALAFAQTANATPSSPYFHRLDTSKVATSGYSCGGITAINVAISDARIKSVLGYDTSSTPLAALNDSHRQALLNLHTPIAYIMGGTSDIAYPAYQSDWVMPFRAPAFEAEHMYAGHTGFWQAVDFQQEVAKIGIYWLDMTLNHSRQAEEYLLSNPCGFCTNPYWSTKVKNLPREDADLPTP